MLTHTELNGVLERLKLVPTNQGGVCDGAAHLWYWYAANSEEKEYYRIMGDISSYWKNVLLSDPSKLEALRLNPSLDEETMRLYQFLRLIAVLQIPQSYAEDYKSFGINGWDESCLGSKLSNVRFQYLDNLLIKKSGVSRQPFYTKQECHTQLHLYKAFGGFGMSHLADYFSTIETHVSTGNVVISIGSSDAGHEIGCRYDAVSGLWSFFDANLLGAGIEQYQAIDKSQLATVVKERLAGFGMHNVVLNLSLHSHNAESIETCRSNLNHNLNQLSERYVSDAGYTLYHHFLAAKKYRQFEQRLTKNATTEDGFGGFRPTMYHNPRQFVKSPQPRFDNGLLTPTYTTEVNFQPATINARDPYHLQSPLMTLIQSGETALALKLINQNNVDLSVTQSLPQPGFFPTADAPVDKYTKDKRFVTGRTALMYACAKANIEVVKAILQSYPDGVTQSDDLGNTPLHYAVQGGDTDCVMLMVKTLMPGSNYMTSHTKQFQAMFIRFPNHGGADGTKFTDSHQKMVMQSINQRGGHAYTALHLACILEEYSIVESLLQHPMLALNLENENGLTPLQLAHEHNEGDALRLLLLGDPRIDINRAMDNEGTAPILWLSEKCADPYVGDKSRELLIRLLNTRLAIDMAVTDINGNNLLQSAIKANDVEMVKLILQNFDIEINHQNYQGQTVLHFAIGKNQAIIDVLFSCDELEDRCNVDGYTAYALASEMGDDRVTTAIATYLNQGAVCYR